MKNIIGERNMNRQTDKQKDSEAPIILDAMDEDFGPNVNNGGNHDFDPLEGWSTRALLATAAGLVVALCIIAVLP